jgi:hypothetical protein
MGQYDSEEILYGELGMDWIPLEMREDRGEIELAIYRNLLSFRILRRIFRLYC